MGMICVNLAKGQLRLNRAALDLMGLKDKDSVAFGQGEGDNLKEWCIKKDKNGFTVRTREQQKTFYGFVNSKQLAFNIFQSIKKTEMMEITFKIMPEPKDGCFELLTSNPIKCK